MKRLKPSDVAILAAVVTLIVLTVGVQYVSLWKKSLNACTVPVQTVKITPVNGPFDEFEVVYIECETTCPGNVQSTAIPGYGGRAYLGPSLIEAVLARIGDNLLPPTLLRSVKPGLLLAVWSYYGVSNASAIIEVEGRTLHVIVPTVSVSELAKAEIEGCSVAGVKPLNSTHSVLTVECGFNAAASPRIMAARGWLIQTRYYLVPGLCVGAVETLVDLRLAWGTVLVVLLVYYVLKRKQNR